MSRATYLSTFGALLVLLLSSCRVVSPPGTLSPEPEEMVTVRLSEGLQDLIWRWENPDGEAPEKPKRFTDEIAELQRRFDRFCTDTGIVRSGAPPLSLRGEIFRATKVELLRRSQAWRRILELNYAFGQSSVPKSIAVDLLVLEVSWDVARKWGLDGMPASGSPPPLLADGVPTSMASAEFAAFRELVLSTRGSAVFAAASAVSSNGQTAVTRQVSEVMSLSGVSEGTVEQKAGLPSPTGRRLPSTLIYEAGEARDVGVVLQFTGTDSPQKSRTCMLNVRVDLTDVVGQMVHDPEGHVRTPLVSALSFEGEIFCQTGKTVLLGSTRRAGIEARRSCFLAFLTPRATPVPPDYPVAENYASPAGQLVLCPFSTFFMPTRRRSVDSIDWGDDDNDDDNGQAEEESPPIPAREQLGLESVGIDCGPGTKVLLDHRMPLLAYFGPPDSVRRLRHLGSRIWLTPTCVLYRAAAIRVTPELWLELTEDQEGEYGESGRVMDQAEARSFLRKVARDKRSQVLSSGMISSYRGHSAILRNVTEATVPESYERRSTGKRSTWLPELGEAQDFGAFLEAESSFSEDLQNVTLGLVLEYTELVGWQPLGPTLGFPERRSSTLETRVEMECGKYMLLGGGGGGRDRGNPFVVWLVGVDRVGWESDGSVE